MKTFVKNDQTLAAFIFVLWSFGLFFAPYAKATFASASNLITILYVLLHVLVFVYTSHLCIQLATSMQKKKMRVSAWIGRALLYAYVLVALVYSASLLIKLIQ